MPRKKDLIQLRNLNIKKRYNEISLKNPKWKHEAVVLELEKTFFLTSRTITAILNNEGNYGKD
ncbi:hypothetical protein LG651_02620 [Tamlana sp. 62-3]|uniref:Uncharacterized protein n=1 Tax=Neotamlana sargassicola TaxID=2883125 RepID=A0A9X1I666_9FLAO|nr:hypothetical protein [Tamlana sargassicola]MCB4807129.1 hypothetical protein [Tamlana sargassicola]